MSDDADPVSDSSNEPQEKRKISFWDILSYTVADWVLRRLSHSARKAAVYDTPEYSHEVKKAGLVQSHLDEIITNRMGKEQTALRNEDAAYAETESVQTEMECRLASAAAGTVFTQVELQGQLDEKQARIENVEGLLVAEKEDRTKAAAQIVELSLTVDSLKADDFMKLGRTIFADSNYGVFILGNDGSIILPNHNACVYAGVNLEDMVGKMPSEVFEGNHFAKTYCQVFEANSSDLLATERAFAPNTFEFETKNGKAPFDIQAHVSGEGGYLVLRPFKTKSLIEKLLQRRPSLVYLKGNVTFDVMLFDHTDTMMNANPKKPFYFDFKETKSISARALDSIAKFYRIFEKNKIACVFDHIPQDAANYLVEQHGIDKVHLRKVRPVVKETVAYDAKPAISPG